MVSWHGISFRYIERFWANLRKFAYYNRTIFEIGFVFLYSFEQILLVWFNKKEIVNQYNELVESYNKWISGA